MKVSNQLMILVSRAAFDSAGHINASRVHLQDGFTNITRVQATSQDDGNIKLSLLDNIPRSGDAGTTMLACNLGIEKHSRNGTFIERNSRSCNWRPFRSSTLLTPEQARVERGAVGSDASSQDRYHAVGRRPANRLHNVRQFSGIRSNEDTHDLHFTRQPFPQCLGMGDGERSRGRRIEIEANGLDAD